MTRNEMIALLSKSGIDLDKLRSEGGKTIDDLVAEVQEREVVLAPYFNTGRLARFAMSSKVMIRTMSTTKPEWLVETHRIFPNGKRIVKNHGGPTRDFRCAVSETLIKGETQSSARCAESLLSSSQCSRFRHQSLTSHFLHR